MMNAYNNFLATALKGDFSIDSEDRLTQIFTACFNCSSTIKRTTLKYLLDKTYHDVSEFEIKTQILMNDDGQKTDSRPDMIIYKNDNPIAIIESKVDASLEEDQLKRHFQNFKGFQSVKFIALTRQIKKTKERCWIHKLWFELAERIEEAVPKKGIDSFIHAQMVFFFKEHKVMRIQTITFDDLKNASDCIEAIQKFKGGCIDIEALYKMNGFIKEVVENISANRWFFERLDRNPTKNLTLYDWYYGDKDGGLGVNIGKNLYIKRRSETRRFSINFFQSIKNDTKFFPSRLSIAVWDSNDYFDEIAVWAIKENEIIFKSINTRKTKLQEISADRVCEIAKDSLKEYLSAKDPKEVDVLNL